MDRDRSEPTSTKSLKVFKINADHPNFKSMNTHLQALLQFYIEGASFISVDPYWHYFLVYMDNKLIAYGTTFEEFHKSPKAGVTISQVLVLPPYQKLGIGSELLSIIYQHYIKDKKCQSMTVEDPAEDFQRMKDGLDIKMILQAGFFRSIRKLGLHNPRVHLNCESFKLAQLEHKEINEIKTKLKLKKDNIQRCFELLLLACLNQDDNHVYEAYRKAVLKKFAETRELLLPYFKFENFADRSMFTIVDKLVYQQPVRVRQKCCEGNGQLACFIGRANRGPQVKSEANAQNDASTMHHGFRATQSDFGGRTVRSEHHKHEDVPMMRSDLLCPDNHVGQDRFAKQMAAFELNSENRGHGSSLPNYRLNRFTPTPWHEAQGQQIRYLLPPTLTAKIRQALSACLSPA